MSTPIILIVEDHKEFRQALRHFLQVSRVPADFLEACSGEEGVLLALRKKPDIVVMDFDLGGINGLDAAGQIKKHLPNSSIILLTVYDSKEISNRDGNGAIRFYISKGELYEQLVPALNKILRENGVQSKHQRRIHHELELAAMEVHC